MRGSRYSLHPTFLNYSLNASLKKLNLCTLDCALLANPFEAAFLGYTAEDAAQSATVRHEKYLYRLAHAFQFYEEAVADGRIRSYGISCHDSLLTDKAQGLKVPEPEGRPDPKTGKMVTWWASRVEYEIQQICDLEALAEKVGGRDHHFRFVQAPFSPAESALLTETRAQKVSRGSEETDSLMEVCR